MTKLYSVKIDVLLEPVGTPDITVSCQDQVYHAILKEPIWFKFDYEAQMGVEKLTVEHKNRNPNDGVTAVIVKTIKLNGIDHPSHVFQGMYHPIGLEPKRTNYVDWNGIWILDYTVPVFTWMHQVQGLGWIYD